LLYFGRTFGDEKICDLLRWDGRIAGEMDRTQEDTQTSLFSVENKNRSKIDNRVHLEKKTSMHMKYEVESTKEGGKPQDPCRTRTINFRNSPLNEEEGKAPLQFFFHHKIKKRRAETGQKTVFYGINCFD
jgi:hypothetical protein